MGPVSRCLAACWAAIRHGFSASSFESWLANNAGSTAACRIDWAVVSIKMAQWRLALLFAALSAVASCGALHPALQTTSGSRHSKYQRPPAADPLPEDHHLLTRHSSHPHAPEQVAIALGGGGIISISWARHCFTMASTQQFPIRQVTKCFLTPFK